MEDAPVPNQTAEQSPTKTSAIKRIPTGTIPRNPPREEVTGSPAKGARNATQDTNQDTTQNATQDRARGTTQANTSQDSIIKTPNTRSPAQRPRTPVSSRALQAYQKLDPKGTNRLRTNVSLILNATTPSPLGVQSASAMNARLTAQGSPIRKRRRGGDGGRRGGGAGVNGQDPTSDAAPIPAGNGEETAENQRPLKRLKISNAITVQPTLDIIELNPNPLRITYQPHPLKDRSDTFYTEAFRRLFRQIEKFVFTYFCFHDLDQGHFFEPWADIDFPPEFISWAERVAEPDLITPHKGGWDEMLRDAVQRKWFIMGIIMKILKVKVFDEDFFGANQQQKDLLFGIERAFFTREGFSRTILRAETCRTIINNNPVTEDFYPQVASLTAQISLLLQPLTKYLYALAPPSGKILPKIQDLYQSLHNIVSTAAYLSLGIRLSPTIIYITEMNPGTIYDSDDQYSLEQQIYIDSKDAVIHEYDRLWVNRRSPFKTQERTLTRELAGYVDQTPAWTATTTKLIAHRSSLAPVPSYTHRAKTKIAVWPMITRYKPGAAGEENKPLEGRDGFRIYPICKAATVCYYGETDEEKRRKRAEEEKRTGVLQDAGRDSTSLRRFVRGKKEMRARSRGEGRSGFAQRAGVAAAVAAVAATAGAAAFYGGVPISVPQVGEVAGMLGNVMEYAGEFVDKLGLRTLIRINQL